MLLLCNHNSHLFKILIYTHQIFKKKTLVKSESPYEGEDTQWSSFHWAPNFEECLPGVTLNFEFIMCGELHGPSVVGFALMGRAIRQWVACFCCWCCGFLFLFWFLIFLNDEILFYFIFLFVSGFVGAFSIW
jgi:hypothetical protein